MFLPLLLFCCYLYQPNYRRWDLISVSDIKRHDVQTMICWKNMASLCINIMQHLYVFNTDTLIFFQMMYSKRFTWPQWYFHSNTSVPNELHWIELLQVPLEMNIGGGLWAYALELEYSLGMMYKCRNEHNELNGMHLSGLPHVCSDVFRHKCASICLFSSTLFCNSKKSGKQIEMKHVKRPLKR